MSSALHPSLAELLEPAPHCSSLDMARDILRESHILLRHSLSHDMGNDTWLLTRWFSDVVQAVLHSPAVASLCGDATIVVTGAFGRGHGLPTSGVQWLLITPSADAVTREADLASFCEASGLVVQPTLPWFSPATAKEWSRRIRRSVASGDGEAIGLFADAGTWVAEELRNLAGGSPEATLPLLTHAAAVRPPAIELVNGLPNRQRMVDIHAQLVVPLAKLARWASMLANSSVTETDRRIACGEATGVLTHHEAAYLREAWQSAVDLQLHRWCDKAGTHIVRVDLLPQLDRSAFGAASRMLSDVFASLLDRYTQAISGAPEGRESVTRGEEK